MKSKIITTIGLSIVMIFAIAALQPSGKAFAALKPEANNRLIKAKNPIRNQYIVVLQDDIRENELEKKADKIARRYGGKIGAYYKYAAKGFSVTMSEKAANRLSRHPSVKFVEENGLDSASGGIQTQSPTPNWGLDRIDQFSLPLNNTYYYSSDGTGVHVFIIDTGINHTHQEFLGSNGLTRVDLANSKNFAVDKPADDVRDCSGHGTAVASIVGGRTLGVAKNVTLHAMRIGNCGAYSTTQLKAAALNHIADLIMQQPSLKPAVINFSWNTPKGNDNQGYIADAVVKLIGRGVTVVNSAGNENTDAVNYTPAHLPAVIVVGATDITDTRATWTFPPSTTQHTSNYGSVVDLFAPGINVKAASFETNTATAFRSGTSFAAPHVAGAAALYLQSNTMASPAQVQSYIVNRATPNKAKNVPAGTTKSMLYVGPSVITSP